MIAAHTQFHPLLLCGSSRTGRVTSGQNRFTFSLYINCLPALHTSGLRQSIFQFVFGGLLAWGVVYVGEGGGWGGNGVGTGTLQAHRRVWVQVTFAPLRLQGVNHIHSHVEHPQLRLRPPGRPRRIQGGPGEVRDGAEGSFWDHLSGFFWQMCCELFL